MLSPEPEEDHTGEPCVTPFGESHLPTHILGPLAGLGGIPVLRRPSPPPRKRLSVGPGGSTPLDFSTRGSANILFHLFRS